MKPMKRTHLMFPAEMLDAVTAESVRTGAPVGELVRRAVAAWLKSLEVPHVK